MGLIGGLREFRFSYMFKELQAENKETGILLREKEHKDQRWDGKNLGEGLSIESLETCI